MIDTKTKLQKTLKVLSLSIMGITCIYFAMNWMRLPDTIPVHYNLAGEVDRMGSKFEMIMLPIVMIVLTSSLFIIEKHPNAWNTGVTITEGNKERVYKTLGNLICVVQFLLVIIFSYLILTTFGLVPMGNLITPVFLTILAVIIVYYIVKILKVSKINKEETPIS